MEWRRSYDYTNNKASSREWELVEKTGLTDPSMTRPIYKRYAELTKHGSVYLACRWSYEKLTWVTEEYNSLVEAQATIAALITFERAGKETG